MKENVVLEVRGVHKYFSGVHALKGVDLDIREGEVHAIVGENGAGKSTLMKVLTGVYSRDGGEYYYKGKPINLTSIHQSIEMGVCCIYQELTIVPMLDVASNIFLGNLPLKGKRIDYKKLYKDTQEILDMMGLKVSPTTLAGDLSVAQHQMLEIGRALARKVQVVIMDEPTSSLTTTEIEVLFKLIRSLTAKGVSVFYISHKLEEITEIADRISVFRDGEKIITFDNNDDVSEDTIIHHMIGRNIENYYNKVPAKQGDVVLEVEHLSKQGWFDDISFTVRAGEVLGFYGLVGAGRSEIVETVFGARKADGGVIKICGNETKIHSPIDAIRAGIALVPEDRKKTGLVLRMDVRSNQMMVKMRETNKWGIINDKAEIAITMHYVKKMAIKTPSLKKPVGQLSGGNQQKVCISKWLSVQPKVLIVDEPTRGIDVGVKAEVYRLISELAAEGVAIIVISSELPEVMGVSDRIITVCHGKITGDNQIGDLDHDKVMRLSLGLGGGNEKDAQ